MHVFILPSMSYALKKDILASVSDSLCIRVLCALPHGRTDVRTLYVMLRAYYCCLYVGAGFVGIIVMNKMHVAWRISVFVCLFCLLCRGSTGYHFLVLEASTLQPTKYMFFLRSSLASCVMHQSGSLFTSTSLPAKLSSDPFCSSRPRITG